MTKPITALEGMTFGCDPELFIVDEDGKFVSPEEFLPGTKEEPFKVDCGAVQVDGMAAEFNIDPVDNFEDFYGNIKTVMHELKKFLPKGHSFSHSVSATFDQVTWNEASHGAKLLGCSPDFNAWTLNVNTPPDASKFPRTRFAGGHLHFGWTNGATPCDPVFYQSCVDLVREMDWHLGGWSVLKDKDKSRREMYGKAGSMRFKPYGVEYRVLSNFWLFGNKPSMIRLWNRMNTALRNMSVGASYGDSEHAAKFTNLLIQTINTGERDAVLEREFFFPIVEY